ncbi:MAG TPA: D-serine ammonia-lyase [Ferruginibacter sp.]|nr:D-serine ammonia-lyase [Chitinophagaceae bacterium]HMT95795.1 D-serine ammonia-lyase [Ferruginibacter sp.]
MPFIDINTWKTAFPLLEEITRLKPVTWLNPSRDETEHNPVLPVSRQDLQDAEKLWERFASYLAQSFPETVPSSGIIESPLKAIPYMQEMCNKQLGLTLPGKLLLKCDNELPIAGSIKARGGIFEVLHYAEQLALQSGLLKPEESYTVLKEERFKKLFSSYTIGVGSTGNLGLSIGLISAKLGFNVSVYMSAEAKKWKKDLLRSIGATVLEFSGDFSEAITAGRTATLANPKGYFVDDENSKLLFLGYSVAAIRLKNQLDALHIRIDEKHPLFVYSPCGVGGSPGGIAFGLRQIFGKNVHCFFAEPTHSPSVLIGLLTGKMHKVSVHDFGIDNITEADGLAVGRPSAFASSISSLLISGIYTLEDAELFRLLYMLGKSENIFVEPSATAGLIGPYEIAKSGYLQAHHINPELITHIAWATGGALVPKDEMAAFYKKGEQLFTKQH